jgi:hypothetical protein
VIVSECIAVLLSSSEELFRAADELLSVIPMLKRSLLREEAAGLAERRQRFPELAPLSPFQLRVVLAIGAIVAIIQECFRDAPNNAILRLTTEGDAILDGGSKPFVFITTEGISEHVAEIAVLPIDTATMVWACFLHLLMRHYPYQTFFGHRIERMPDGIRLHREPAPPS